MPLPQVSSSYVYSFGSYHVDKQTNKHTDTAKTSNAVRYATTLGKYTVFLPVKWLDGKVVSKMESLNPAIFN